jgi:hypothetical protein
MGYNSSLFILNDAWDLALSYPKDFVNEVTHRVMNPNTFSRLTYREEPIDEIGRTAPSFGFKNHANPFAAMTCEHADWHQLVLMGGNYATILGQTFAGNRGHHRREDVKRDLNEILDQYGLKVVEKHGTKRNT